MLSAKDKLFLNMIKNGELSIDKQGCIWRHIKRVGGRKGRIVNVDHPARAEKTKRNNYLIVQGFSNGKSYCISSHHLVWIYNFGAIPDKYIIHHLDGNKTNNTPLNLVCVPHRWHVWHHMIGKKHIHRQKGETQIIKKRKQRDTCWQKTSTKENIKKWHKKTIESKHKNYIDRIKKTYYLHHKMKMSAKEIAKEIGTTDRTVYQHIEDYIKEVMPICPCT